MSDRSFLVPDERFTCQSCGRCCTMWTITLDEDKATKLRTHNWSEDPFMLRRGESDSYRIKMVRGRCFFLDENNQRQGATYSQPLSRAGL